MLFAGTPTSYQHGEIVFCGVPNDWSTAAGTISAGDDIRAMSPDDIKSNAYEGYDGEWS